MSAVSQQFSVSESGIDAQVISERANEGVSCKSSIRNYKTRLFSRHLILSWPGDCAEAFYFVFAPSSTLSRVRGRHRRRPPAEQSPLHPARLLSECRFVLRPRPFAAAVPRRFQRMIPSQQPVLHLRRLSDPLRLPVADLIDRHGYGPLRRLDRRLQRFKWLQHYQVFDARYLGGSRYFSSELVSCSLPEHHHRRHRAPSS